MMETIVRFFQEGGLFMYPIGLVMAVGLAIAIERFLFLTRADSANRRDYEPLLISLRAGRLKEVQEITREPKSGVAHMLAEALLRLPQSRRRADLELAMEESLLEILPAVERRTAYLSALANIATLLGLLGTIIGLIQAFAAVAGADPAEKAVLLSQSISVAMNTTAFGLIVAIPLLLAHANIQGKSLAITEMLEIAMVKFLGCLERREGEANPQSTGSMAPVARPAQRPATTAAAPTATVPAQAAAQPARPVLTPATPRPSGA